MFIKSSNPRIKFSKKNGSEMFKTSWSGGQTNLVRGWKKVVGVKKDWSRGQLCLKFFARKLGRATASSKFLRACSMAHRGVVAQSKVKIDN